MKIDTVHKPIVNYTLSIFNFQFSIIKDDIRGERSISMIK
jgi:hypothetical protein